MKMRLIDWLKMTDTSGLTIIIYLYDEQDVPAYVGTAFNIPWWIAEMYLVRKSDEEDEPISYRPSLGEEYDNEPGLVISLQ